MAEPLGRPKTLVRRHVLEVKEDTQEWLHDEIQKAIATHEAGQAAKGFLSTNAGALIATFAVVSTLIAFPPTQKLATAFIGFWHQQMVQFANELLNRFVPTPGEVVDKIAEGAHEIQEAAKDVWDEINRRLQEAAEAAREAIEGGSGEIGDIVFGTPLGPIPLTEEQKRILRGAGEQPPL